MIYQFGFTWFGWTFWFRAEPKEFADKVHPLIVRGSQIETIKPFEILPMFRPGFILADGRRKYRGISFEGETNEAM